MSTTLLSRIRESIVWDWDLSHRPLSDYHGNSVSLDFADNMVAIVQFSDGNDGGMYTLDSEKDRSRIMLGKKFVDINKMQHSLRGGLQNRAFKLCVHWNQLRVSAFMMN